MAADAVSAGMSVYYADKFVSAISKASDDRVTATDQAVGCGGVNPSACQPADDAQRKIVPDTGEAVKAASDVKSSLENVLDKAKKAY